MEIKRGARNHEIKLKLNKDEVDKLQAKANKLGLKISQYVRMTSLNAQAEVRER